MLKKLIYIIPILALIASGIFAWFYLSERNVKSNNVESFLNSTGTIAVSQLPANYSITDTFPKTDTITIGTGSGSIEVKNFYKTIVDTEEGFVILEDNADYEIVYDRSTSQFYIYLITDSAPQSQAENELLNILGIGQQDVCKLDVLVLRAGQTNGVDLSFCANR